MINTFFLLGLIVISLAIFMVASEKGFLRGIKVLVTVYATMYLIFVTYSFVLGGK